MQFTLRVLLSLPLIGMIGTYTPAAYAESVLSLTISEETCTINTTVMAPHPAFPAKGVRTKSGCTVSIPQEKLAKEFVFCAIQSIAFRGDDTGIYGLCSTQLTKEGDVAFKISPATSFTKQAKRFGQTDPIMCAFACLIK